MWLRMHLIAQLILNKKIFLTKIKFSEFFTLTINEAIRNELDK